MYVLPLIITLLGDSNVQFNQAGWVGNLSEIYVTKFDFLNHGISGYTSRNISEILPLTVPSRAVILIGSNDPYFNVSLNEYSDNIERIGNWMYDPIFITPPPVDESRISRNNSLILEYRNALVSKCELRGYRYLDLWPLINITLLKDGLHFGDQANEVLFSNLVDLINVWL